MMGTFNCVYETPCGWCSKWDKRCDKKIPERGQRAKCNPVDDAMDKSLIEAIKLCVSESDHDWECCGLSSGGDEYRCRKCGARKTFPLSYSTSTTISGN